MEDGIATLDGFVESVGFRDVGCEKDSHAVAVYLLEICFRFFSADGGVELNIFRQTPDDGRGVEGVGPGDQD